MIKTNINIIGYHKQGHALNFLFPDVGTSVGVCEILVVNDISGEACPMKSTTAEHTLSSVSIS